MLSKDLCDRLEHDVALLLAPILNELKSFDLETMITMSRRENLAGFKTLIRDLSESYLAPGYISIYSLPTSSNLWTDSAQLLVPVRLDLSSVRLYVDVAMLADVANVRVIHAELRRPGRTITDAALASQIVREIRTASLHNTAGLAKTPGSLHSSSL